MSNPPARRYAQTQIRTAPDLEQYRNASIAAEQLNTRRTRSTRSASTLIIALVDAPDPATMDLVRSALRAGVQSIAIDLGGAGHLDDRACQAIRDVFTAIQHHQTPGARARLVLAGVSDAQLEILRAARLTNVIPVERANQPLVLTSELA
jgi:hypothetical protein